MPGSNVIETIQENNVLNTRIRFESLYDKYAAKLYGFFLIKSNSREEAEELLRKVFVRVWAECKIINEDEEKKIIIIALSILRSQSL